MGGGLMQLVAYGAQDIYLTGNPQITFFKVVYRRHTNFSMECIEQTIQGTPADSGSSTVTVSRNGDLVGRVYVTLDTANIGNGSRIISEVELEIGGQLIDRQYSEWMNIWAELTVPGAKRLGYKFMIGDNRYHTSGSPEGVGNIQVPLHFWFCRNPGCYLPLIALQYHEVKLKFTWGVTADYGGSANDVSSSKVFADYIYLDTDERRRFAQVSHEYLIEQIQRESTTGSASMKLNFNHPVKELIWTDSADTSYGTARLTLNGHDRFADQQEEYFRLRQPYDHHTAIPRQNIGHTSGSNHVGVHYHEAFDGDPQRQISVVIPITANTVINQIDVRFQSPITLDSPGDIGFSLVNSASEAIVTADTDCILRGGAGPSSAGTSTDPTTATTLSANAALVLIPGKTSFSSADNLTALVTTTQDISDTEIPAEVMITLHFHHFAATANTQGVYEGDCTYLKKEINVYSFALKPEEHQPSGTCNFSRIDSARLVFGTAPTGTVNIYAVNYNVLRIMSGMGGLAYSN